MSPRRVLPPGRYRKRSWCRRCHRDDQGIAMLLVVLICTILMLLPIALASATVGQLPVARHDQDSAAALAAAEAGVDDYLNRLNQNPSYWQSSIPTGTPFTCPSTTKCQPTTPLDGNLALTTWVPVSSVSNTYYCYTVDQSGTSGSYTYSTNPTIVYGFINLTSYGYSTSGTGVPAPVPSNAPTGSGPNACAGAVPSGGVERVVRVQLRQNPNFLNYLELTDLQLADQNWYNQQHSGSSISDCQNNPSATPPQYAYYWTTPGSPAGATTTGPPADCAPLRNYWGTSTSKGLETYLGAGNIANGPIRSNDDYYICGNTNFNGPITSSDPTGTRTGGKYWVDPAGTCGTDNPTFNGTPSLSGGTVTGNATKVKLPADASSLIAPAQSGGCYYVGPTYVQLYFDAPSGLTKMNVTSPMTTSANPGCLGAGLSLPGNRLIYVDSGTPNLLWNCFTVFTVSALFLNAMMENLPTGDSCTLGTAPADLFIQGTLHDQLTAASAGNVFITGDLKYCGTVLAGVCQNDTPAGSTDVLGLIANNYIQVDHQITCLLGCTNTYLTELFWPLGLLSPTNTVSVPADWGTNPPSHTNCSNILATPDCLVTVDAAMIALNHSFGVENYALGAPLGTIKVYGSVAEEYADVEGTSGNGCSYTTQGVATQLCSGYNASFSYDPRLVHLSPPYFLVPTVATWRPATFEECPLTGCAS